MESVLSAGRCWKLKPKAAACLHGRVCTAKTKLHGGWEPSTPRCVNNSPAPTADGEVLSACCDTRLRKADVLVLPLLAAAGIPGLELHHLRQRAVHRA